MELEQYPNKELAITFYAILKIYLKIEMAEEIKVH